MCRQSISRIGPGPRHPHASAPTATCRTALNPSIRHSGASRNPASGSKRADGKRDPGFRRDNANKKVTPALQPPPPHAAPPSTHQSVIPAQAGIQLPAATARTESWIPAFAGMTPTKSYTCTSALTSTCSTALDPSIRHSGASRNPASGSNRADGKLDPGFRRDDANQKVTPALQPSPPHAAPPSTHQSGIPAQAGIQLRAPTARTKSWIPAFAGMTPIKK